MEYDFREDRCQLFDFWAVCIDDNFIDCLDLFQRFENMEEEGLTSERTNIFTRYAFRNSLHREEGCDVWNFHS